MLSNYNYRLIDKYQLNIIGVKNIGLVNNLLKQFQQQKNSLICYICQAVNIKMLLRATMKKQIAQDELVSTNLRSTLQNQQQKTQIQLKKNRQKKQQLLKMFKPEENSDFNLKVLHDSELMSKNQLFAYLVKSINKQRHGMFYTMSDKCNPVAPSKLQNKIKQFLYNSLQQATLIPQSQLIKTKYLQRLFVWFTNVFKEREIQMGFKKQKVNKQNQDGQVYDQDWLVRKTYKSNMPLQLSTYQRKMITLNPSFGKRMEEPQNLEQEKQKQILSLPSSHQQKKLYQRNSNKDNSRQYQSILPSLKQKSFYSQIQNVKQSRQDRELQQFKSQWQKKKAHFGQQTAKNFYKQRFTHDKLFRKTELKNSPFKRLQKFKMSSTLGCFNSEQKGQKLVNQFQFFHPYLTGNKFNDIKMKKIQKLKGERMNFNKTFGTFQYQTKKVEQEQQKIVFEQQGNSDLIQQKEQINLSSNSNLRAVCIDGLGLFSNPFDKVSKTKKPK